MEIKKKNNLIKMAFLINGLLFLGGGIVLIADAKFIFGIIQILASFLNFTMILKIRNERTIEKLNYLILAMNVIVCISIAVDNILANKLYIQYVWFIAAIVSLVVLLVQIGKKKALTKNL